MLGHPRRAAAQASSYRPRPLYSTASAHSSTEIPIPSPRRVILGAAAIDQRDGLSLATAQRRSPTAAYGARVPPVASVAARISSTSEAAVDELAREEMHVQRAG